MLYSEAEHRPQVLKHLDDIRTEEAPHRTRNFSLGLHMIVKNEAHNLHRVLQFADKFDQVVIVDTGSTDGTVALIKNQYPFVELYEIPWPEDFSKARNFALEKLNTDVFMWLDADDVVDRESMLGWFSVAENVHNNGGLCHAVLPYHYIVDENNEPLLKQFRERILKDPRAWEWREPIHEVCCAKNDADSQAIFIDQYPVVHKPHRHRETSPHRNWKILQYNNQLNPDELRTQYYILRESLDRGFWEYGIEVGQRLLSHEHCQGYYKYDAHKYVGDCYQNLYERDKIDLYAEKSEEHYRASIAIDENRNESRDSLISLFIKQEKINDALREAEALKLDPPKTVATVSFDKYGPYKFALIAYIYMRYFTHIHSAIWNHLISLDSPTAVQLMMENDNAIRAYIRNNNVGVVYCDEQLIQEAGWVKNKLIETEMFDDVVISTNPMIIGMAEKWYFHLTTDVRTCYREDHNPNTTKFLLSNEPTVPIGWQDYYQLPTSEHDVDFILQDIMSTTEVSYHDDLEEAFRHCKRSLKPMQLLLFSANKKLNEDFAAKISDNTVNKTPRLVINENGQLVGIIGSTKVLNSFLTRENTLYIESQKNIQFFELTKYNIKGIKGIDFRIMQTTKTNGKVAIFAAGPEPWDGTVHHRLGIGASETSAIFLAEELVSQNYDVAVYSGVERPVKVSGVVYLPHTHFQGSPKELDALIVSRIPDVLKGTRHAKKQYLWLHDLPEVYRDLKDEELIVDKYICVSEWHEKAFKEHFSTIPAWKIGHVNNGLHLNKRNDKLERIPNRCAWMSSPDRGIPNLIDIMRLQEEKPEAYMFYGFYNMRISHSTDFAMFKYANRMKYAVRHSGINLVGRVPLYDLKTFLQTCDYVSYPSSFNETFCVSVVEAAHAGTKLFVNQNGSTYETLKLALDKQVTDVVCLPTGKSTHESSDNQAWADAVRTFESKNRNPEISQVLTWEYLAKNEWIPLIKGEK